MGKFFVIVFPKEVLTMFYLDESVFLSQKPRRSLIDTGPPIGQGPSAVGGSGDLVLTDF